MAAPYTFDVFSSLDGYASYDPPGDWGGYWGKQGPEFLDHRLAVYADDQRMVFGATTFRAFTEMLAAPTEESGVLDPWVSRMRRLPATVLSSTLTEPLDWPDAQVVSGDAVELVARLKEESEVPLRSHGSLSLNRALLAAGLVDLLQVTVFPVLTSLSGADPIYQGAGDYDLELGAKRHLRRPHPGAHLPPHPALRSVDSGRHPARGVVSRTAGTAHHRPRARARRGWLRHADLLHRRQRQGRPERRALPR